MGILWWINLRTKIIKKMIQNGHWDLIEQYIIQLNTYTYAVYTNCKKNDKRKNSIKTI